MPKLSSVPDRIRHRVSALESPFTPRAVVLYARAHRNPKAAAASLEELARLVRGLGMQVVRTVVHRGGGAIGPGQLTQLAEVLAPLHQPLLVMDEAVRPGQLRKLEAGLNAEVCDRTDIILRVFERRAQTRMARLEVERARLSFDMPRVRDVGAINDRRGGGGRGERGHTGVELRKQRMRARLVTLDHELGGLRRLHQAELERRSEVPAVALVGYTNAGKSSLMRALTGSDVLVEDKLFATLSTTVRALEPATAPRVLVTDTVGFIEDLPHELVASFRSTLAEAAAADLLLFVVDAADDAWRAQLRVAEETIQAIGAERPALIVCNKIDRVGAERRGEISLALPQALQLSAHAAADVQRLRAAILDHFDQRMLDDVLLVPHDQGHLVGEVHEQVRVVEQVHDEAGTWVRVRGLPATLARLRHRLPVPPVRTAADLVARARRHGLVVRAGEVPLSEGGLDFLVAQVEAAPEAEEGVARDAIRVDGQRYMLRTPRRPEAAVAAEVEARVLRLVAPRLPVAVPRWRIHAPDLIAYARLPGTPAVTVSPAGPIWNVIDPAHTGSPPFTAFLDSYAALLAGLHAIPAELVRNAELPRPSMAELRAQTAAAMARVREALAPSAALWARWQRWVDDDGLWPGDDQRVLVHGDLHPGHWLLAPDGRLTGVIDWTEAAFSDPAIDLALFHGSFGAPAVTVLLGRLEQAGGRVGPRLAEHVAERWAAFPVGLADWALRHDDAGVLAHARSLLVPQ
jgi:GTP-binding protein HflX